MNADEQHDLDADAAHRQKETERAALKKAILEKGRELCVLVNHLKQNYGPHLRHGFCDRWEQRIEGIQEELE